MSSDKNKFVARWTADPSPYFKHENDHEYSTVLAAMENPNVTKEHLRSVIDSYGAKDSTFVVKHALHAAHDRKWRHGPDGLDEYVKKNYRHLWSHI